MRLWLTWVPTSCPSPLPERTGQTSCQPALGCAPAARDSSPCKCPGERWRTQSAADRVCPLGRRLVAGQVGCPGSRGDWGWVILTARGSAWVRTHGGCTACTGRHGRPGWRGSPALTANQPLAGAGSQSSLKQHRPSLQGLCWCPMFPAQRAKTSVLETERFLLCQA